MLLLIRLKLRKPVEKNSNIVVPVTAVSSSRSLLADVNSQKDSLGCLVQGSQSLQRKGVPRKINSLVVSSSCILNSPSTLKHSKFSSKAVGSSVAQNNHIDENGIIHEAAITPESTVEGISQVGKRKKNLSHSKKTKSSLIGEGTVSKETSHQKKHTNIKSNGKIAPQPSEVVPKDDSWNNGVKKNKSTAASRKKKPEIDASHGKGAGEDPVVAVKSNNQKEIESEDDPQIHQPVEKLEAPKSKKPSKKSAAKSAQSKPLQTGKMCPVISPVLSQTGNSQQHLGPLYPPLGKTVVIVESITKAKTIQNYLGDMFQVLPSYGHVRNLAARSGSVRPEDDFSMVWEVPSTAWTHLTSIKVKDVESIGLDDALKLLQYPKTRGNHPEDKKPIILKISKYGFSVRHRRTCAPLPKNVDPERMTIEMALKFLTGRFAKQIGRPKTKNKVMSEA